MNFLKGALSGSLSGSHSLCLGSAPRTSLLFVITLFFFLVLAGAFVDHPPTTMCSGGLQNGLEIKNIFQNKDVRVDWNFLCIWVGNTGGRKK